MTSTDFTWQIDPLLKSATPVSAKGKRSPLDMAFTNDTEVLYRLEPSAWVWESDPAKIFFLKSHTRDGLTQPHHPFGAATPIAGRPDMISVRYDPEVRYRGCHYEYNLGVVVRQTIDGETVETPLIIDPDAQNGGHG